ncbi:MAG: PfaD family polyunsaturated fatty acid/polyketide biosynthesis protein [Myxococcota bacterium]|jgi:PfaD family protein|nr:PfaD family polyunsaturated fatty acid/polyketide biosynthesis protein [Myxococcota bacterium]
MNNGLSTCGLWRSGPSVPAFHPEQISDVVNQFRESAYLVQASSGHLGVGLGGEVVGRDQVNGVPTYPLLAALPPLFPEWLGDRSFLEVHGVRFPYVTGAMANGIATTRLVAAMGRAGMLGFFGAAGLPLAKVTAAVDELLQELGTEYTWGANLIHSPNEPALEEAVADMYIRKGVLRVSAAAYMSLSPSIVRYACSGLTMDAEGRIHRKHHVFAKISHPEVARPFLEPAPPAMLQALVSAGKLTAEEARIAQYVPVAEDITTESDSGGHTDNRPLTTLFPTIVALRDELVARHGYTRPIRIGAAGGLGTPTAVAAAFSMGAAYVLTGSVNQACVESGLDESGRQMLAQASMADVVMAPAADMFEQGVKVQVLQRGTMFAARAGKLYELYRSCASLDEIPEADRARLEKQVFRSSLEEAWESTRAFWMERDPGEVELAESDPRHKMALVFRAYLGLASRWAIVGDADRRIDYQIWCGPAMGAFNQWVAGTFLAEPANRSVVQVALNLLEGAATVTRAQQLRSYGLPVPSLAFDYRPRPLA